MKILSILIVTLEGREDLYNRLIQCLEPQLNDSVEVLTYKDTRELTTGAKRNDLIMRATGKYVCFVDDDDLVSEDYVELILKAAEKDPDCIGIEVEKTVDGKNPTTNIHSLKALERGYYWAQGAAAIYFVPDHLTPIKREIVSKVKFKDISKAEDTYFSLKVLKYLKTEEYIPKPIYYYQYITRKKEYENKSFKVSCMMLTYKRLEAFQRALDCYMSQTYKDKELVVVSNGTSEYNDKIRDMTIKYPDINFVRIDKPHSFTTGDLRNIGLESSIGDYICIWDDDDISRKDRLQVQMTPIKLSMSQGSLLKKFMMKYEGGCDYAINWAQGAAATILFKKTDMRYKALNKGEDSDFISRFGEKYTINHLNLHPKIYTYVYNDDNLTDKEEFDNIIKNQVRRNQTL